MTTLPEPASVGATPCRTGLSWTAAELRRRQGWCLPLPAAVGAEFAAFVATGGASSVEAFAFDPGRLPRTAAFGAELRARLLRGDGLCWLRGLDRFAGDDEALRCLYVAIGCAIGTPMLQYGRLYPVIDRGMTHETAGVPVSMTGAETGFHTDSSAVGVVPDVVALLCEQPSDSGGDSLVSNALPVHELLRRRHPEALALLQLPLVRDIVTPGCERTPDNLRRNRFPVFAASDDAGGVLFRYMRYWIEVGQQRAGAPLDQDHLRALDLLDALLAHPDHVVRFRLERGDALWVNNRVLAHNRTAFRDTPGNQRRLQRMWLQVPAA